MSEPVDLIEVGRYDDAMAGKPFPRITFTEWSKREEVLRGEQLILDTLEYDLATDTLTEIG